MKKFLALVPVLAVLFVAVPARAATIDLSPATVTVTAGQTVSVVVSVNPASATVSAVKTELSYSESLLTPTSFTFAPTWIPVTVSGYDQMSGGTIIKSAGYPGGLKNAATLGTIVFTAKAAGTATIAVTNASIAYDSNNQNTLTGTQGTSAITIQTAAVTTPGGSIGSTAGGSTGGSHTTTAGSGTTASHTTVGTHTATTGTGQIAVATAISEPAPSSTTTDAAQATSTLQPQTAAAAAAGSAGFLSSWWAWLLLVIILAIIGGWWWYAQRQEA